MVGWLAQSTKAGDAGLVASVLEAAQKISIVRNIQPGSPTQLASLLAESSKKPSAKELKAEAERLAERQRRADLLRSFAPLARWMLEKGAAELRRPDRGPLLLALFLEALTDATPAELQLILRYLSLLPKPEVGFSPHHRDLFWKAAEHVLEEGAPEALICELVAAMYRGDWWAEHCTHPLEVPEKLPRACQAIFQGLVDGTFESIAHVGMERFQPVAWALAFRHVPIPPKLLRFSSVSPLDRALKILQTEATQSPPPAAVAGWARVLVLEWIRIHGLRAKKELERLLALTALPALSSAVSAALREALEAAPQTEDTPLALRILAEQGGAPGAIRAILCLELERPEFRQRSNDRLNWLQEELGRVLNLPWNPPVFGIDLARMFQGVRNVRFTHLAQEDQVEVREDCVYLHEASYQHLVDRITDGEEVLATAMLYFLHEWIHLQQGIGQKRMVDLLRETGGESTLLHLDLSADHAAALLARRAEPRWTLAWLKELQSRSLLNYPAGPGHTFASRGRKTNRLISLRVDYLVRNATRLPKWFPLLGDGYVFADLSPGGGAMFLLVSGPPVAVVRHTKLSPEHTTLLTTIMDHREDMSSRLGDLDAVLRTSFL
jgi:hypothetical protein